jgi:septal ring factor EnvC (AmiA/AmiB activator)
MGRVCFNVLRATTLLLLTASLDAASAGAQAPRQSPDKTAAQAQVRRATERLKILQREADALTAQARTLIAELRKLELDRQIRGQEVARAQAEVELAAAELATAEAETRRLHAAVEAERPVVASRLADLYKLGRPGYWRMLLSVDDLQSVGRTFRTVTTIAEQDRTRIEGYSRTLAALAETRTTLAKRAEAAAGTRAEAQAARAALERAVAAQSARIEEIDARRDLNAQLTGELQEAARQLQSSVGGLAPGRPASAAGPLPIAPFRGDLPWPASGTARSAFGRGRTSRFSAAIQRNGILIGVAEGDRVRAVHEGRVAFAGPFAGFGNLVILEHGEGDHSLYGHLRVLGVARGDAVERQAVLGETGLTPAGVPGLYFELRIDGRAVDPLQWLKRR